MMDRDSGEELVALEQVQRVVLSSCQPLSPIEVELSDALGFVLAEDVHAAEDLPPFANTAMDGYAVRADDTKGAPVELSVIGVIAAGTAPTQAVEPGTTVQIMTGAPIPPGADGIAIVERTEPGSSDGRVRILDEVSPGAYVRRSREATCGAVIWPSLPARSSALLTSACWRVSTRTRISVHSRPKVGVLSTGDELVGGNVPLELGQIRDSNRQGLLAALRRDGFVGIDLGVRRDDEEAISAGDSRGDRALRCSAHLRRRQHGRVRLRESGSGDTGRRVRGSSPPVQGCDQARKAVVVRGSHQAGRPLGPCLRSAGQPRLLDGELSGRRSARAQEACRSPLTAPPPDPRRRGR